MGAHNSQSRMTLIYQILSPEKVPVAQVTSISDWWFDKARTVSYQSFAVTSVASFPTHSVLFVQNRECCRP